MNLGDMRRHQEASDRRDEEFYQWQRERSLFGNATMCSERVLFENCDDPRLLMSLSKFAGENVQVDQKGFNKYMLRFYGGSKFIVSQEAVEKLTRPKGVF